LKHLIQCHCTLPQFKGRKEPVFHKFVVFSECNDNGEIISKLSMCNNCGVIHSITDFCKSELYYGADDSLSIVTKNDIKNNIPEDVSNILDSHNCDLATWEHVCFTYENNLFDEPVVIAKNSIAGSTQIKSIIFNSDKSFKIKSFLRKDDVDGKTL